MSEMITKGEIDRFLKKYPKIEYVNCILIDMLGLPRGKQLSVDKIYDLTKAKLSLPQSMLLQNSRGEVYNLPAIDAVDPDFFAYGIANTLYPSLWSTPYAHLNPEKVTHAHVMIALNDRSNKPFVFGGRELVKTMINLIKEEFGLQVSLAIELEFYLLALDKTNPKGEAVSDKHHLEPFETFEPLNHLFNYPYLAKSHGSCYGVDKLESIAPLVDRVNHALKLQNIDVEGVSSEYGEGQFEVNLKYRPDALRACDEAVLLKHTIKSVAKQFGVMATFMAVPNEGSANGMHINISLQDEEGNNVLVSKTKEGKPSKTCLSIIAGMQQSVDDCMLIFAPNFNSYKRYYTKAFSPSSSDSWGVNNRTVAIRIPAINIVDDSYKKSMRVEHRVAGADSNPYLSTAATLIGVYLGLKKRLKPKTKKKKNHYDVPLWDSKVPNMAYSLSQWSKKRNLCRKYFGNDFCDAFYQQRISEWYDYMGSLTQKDFDWYFYY